MLFLARVKKRKRVINSKSQDPSITPSDPSLDPLDSSFSSASSSDQERMERRPSPRVRRRLLQAGLQAGQHDVTSSSTGVTPMMTSETDTTTSSDPSPRGPDDLQSSLSSVLQRLEAREMERLARGGAGVELVGALTYWDTSDEEALTSPVDIYKDQTASNLDQNSSVQDHSFSALDQVSSILDKTSKIQDLTSSVQTSNILHSTPVRSEFNADSEEEEEPTISSSSMDRTMSKESTRSWSGKDVFSVDSLECKDSFNSTQIILPGRSKCSFVDAQHLFNRPLPSLAYTLRSSSMDLHAFVRDYRSRCMFIPPSTMVRLLQDFAPRSTSSY